MNGRAMRLLTLATAAALLLALALLWREARQSAPEAVASGPLLGVFADRLHAVDSVLLEKAGARLAIDRRDGQWLIVSAGDAPAKASRLASLLLDLGKIEKREPRTDDPALYERLGLAADALAITVRIGAEEETLYLGKAAGGGADRRYARTASGKRAWLVETGLDPALEAGPWADLALPAMGREMVKTVSITQPNGDRLEIGRDDPTDSDFHIRDLGPDENPVYPSVANGIAGALANLSYLDVRRAHAVDFSQAVVTRYESWDGALFTLRLAEADDGWWANPQNGDDLAGWAFRLPNHKAEDLTSAKASLIERATSGE